MIGFLMARGIIIIQIYWRSSRRATWMKALFGSQEFESTFLDQDKTTGIPGFRPSRNAMAPFIASFSPDGARLVTTSAGKTEVCQGPRASI
jgi:hypothetical protein